MHIKHTPLGPLMGLTAFTAVMVVTGVVGLNLTAAAAGLNPLLGVAALLIALAIMLSLGDRLGERWIPAAMSAFRSCCRGAVRHLRADR